MDNKHYTILEALYGERESLGVKPLWDPTLKVYTPIQSSVIKEYVNDVNRFLFSGGVSLDNGDMPEDHPGLPYVEATLNKITPLLFSIWESAALYGEILVTARPTSTGQPSLEFFDPRDYKIQRNKDGSIQKAKIKTIMMMDGDRYVYRFEVDGDAFYEYPLVKEQEARFFNWENARQIYPHGLGEVPAQIIRVNPSIRSKRGKSEFNHASIETAKSIAVMEYGIDENFYFTGHPLIDSPDPERTIADLNQKRQVLQKLPDDEGGEHKLLQPQALGPDQIALLQFKKESFKRSMGITNTQETRLSDASGVALMIMNDGLISKAQSKWQEIVTGGLDPLLNLIFRMGQSLGLYNIGGDYVLKLIRAAPYFVQTQGEKLQSLDIAERLTDLGVSREVALKETIWPHKTLDEIAALLRPNLEDI